MLEAILNLSPDEKVRIEEHIGPLKSVTEFCSDLLEATKEIPLKDKLTLLLPWAAKGGKIVGEVTPLAKVLVKVVDELTKEKDPATLGTIVCSLAYQHSAALALTLTGEPQDSVPFEHSLQSAKQELKRLDLQVSLVGFSLEAPLAHPFIWQADDALSVVVRTAGYNDREWRQIQLLVHDLFRTELVDILAHGETAARFEPFTKRLSLGDDAAAHAALNAHIERQRWVFENRPVLNVEPFTLADVYVDTDCGKLKWGEFASPIDPGPQSAEDRFDPFSEEFGGRQPLLETVLEYLRDPKFNDAIVVQGAPGSGKSSFTLRLARALRREGLRPIRVRLKFLDLKKNLSEALAEVVRQPEEGEDSALSKLPPCSDPFLKDAIFQEKTTFGNAEICPYVLILDGWDEISVAVNEGFEIEVGRMLESVRRQFLLPRAVKVRVILTGRPSLAIESGQFLRDDTPVLTVREYTADQLGAYVSNVKAALNQKAVASTEQWPSVNWTVLREIVESYRKNSSKLDILGLPLLAHLSLRLLAQWQGGPQNLLSDRTALYRHLLDVTCQKAGKSSSDSDDLLGQARLKGSELRRMLQGTAVAITTCGQESISFRELKLRLRQNRHQMMETVTNAGRDHPLTSLMISFYFKGGQERLGCEFLHKSFREYLYAESIIEALKEYAKNLAVRIAKREPYWKDFETTDPRLQFSRNLSQLLCPYPLTSEIQEHIAKLLEWEIDRSQEEQKEVGIGEPLALVTFEQWKLIRNGLADLWDWWGDAVHLRPQPYRNDSETLCYKSAYVNELVDYSLPRDRTPDAPTWWPGRVVNVDSNIGDGLCRLNAWVHGHILNAQEWFNTSVELSTGRQGVDDRPYQYVIQPAGTTFVLFMPSGASLDYFRNYCSRINAAGNRPGGFFPGNIQLPGVCLSGADLSGANFNGADLRGADLRVTDFRGAKLRGAKFSGADLSGADLRGTDLSGADFSSASLFSAYLGRANMIAVLLDGADLTMADLTQTVRSGADISQVNFPDVKLDGKTQTRNRGGLSTAQ